MANEKESTVCERTNGTAAHKYDVHIENLTKTSEESWIQRNKVQLFVANFSLLQLFQMMFVVYFIGIVRTIEKRYGLSSTHTGLIMSLNDVVHISVVLFVGYFGRKGHKPIIMGSTAIFLSVSSLLYASPYFLYGADLPLYLSNISSSHKTEEQFCTASSNSSSNCQDEASGLQEEIATKVTYILCLASALNGFGGSAMNILGMAYVDQNAENKNIPLFFGIITSTFSLGPIFGIVLAAFCTSMPEDLQETDKTPSDPSWIGAWWLGYIVFTLFLFSLTLPIFFFPKHIKKESSYPKERKLQKNLTLAEQVKEFPKATKELLQNKAFLCLLITSITSVYVITGIFINMPRYFEIHFHMPAFKANIGTALPGIAGVFGGFIGGAIMTRLKLDIVGSTKMIVFSLFVTTVGIFVSMMITCPQVQMAGDWNDDLTSVSMEQFCNKHCDCDLTKNTNSPICAPDGLTHFSPCYAGCTESTIIDGVNFYANCTCFEGVAMAGACAQPCTMQFYAFSFTMLCMSFLSSLGRVPGTVVQLRIVGDDEGSYALGITSFAINLFGFIPGPILFGSLIDSTCLLWQEFCDKLGACILFDTNMFRYKIFGVSLLFQILTLLCSIGLLVVVRKMKPKDNGLEKTDIIIKDCADEVQLLADHISSL